MLDHFADRWRLRRLGRRGGNFVFRQRHRAPLECDIKHFVDPLDGNDLESILDVVRNLREIPDVFLGNQNRLDAASVGRQQSFL